MLNVLLYVTIMHKSHYPLGDSSYSVQPEEVLEGGISYQLSEWRFFG